MAIQYLFLDLDDTIFPTRSIGYHHFAELFNSLETAVSLHLPDIQFEDIKQDLWRFTFYDVAEKYGFTDQMVDTYFEQMSGMKFSFEIFPYPDYHHLQKISLPKYLITSGSEPIQRAKVEALGIGPDYVRVCYDDRMQGSAGKEQIFRELIRQESLPPDAILVIGDNPDSEIKAANSLGLNNIMIDRMNRFPDADGIIRSFSELHSLIG